MSTMGDLAAPTEADTRSRMPPSGAEVVLLVGIAGIAAASVIVLTMACGIPAELALRLARILA